MENEQKAFELILHSGNARSLAHEALSLIKTKNRNEANKKLEEAQKELIEAQKLHAQFLRNLANNEEIKMDLLMVHAEDHASGSQSCLEMAKEIVAIYERMDKDVQ